MAYQEPGSFPRVPSHLDVRYVVYVVLFGCLPGPWQSFLHHPSNTHPLDSSYMVTLLAIHAQHHASYVPQTLYSHIVRTYLQTERPKQGIHGSLSPLAPCKEQGIPTAP